ncbi:hypothetical protein BDQ17DRAFT_270185 [Cyathus striatus]|nr:hypothetical protein BDQ17DRAFT_270185 [Cyathus striatus]
MAMPGERISGMLGCICFLFPLYSPRYAYYLPRLISARCVVATRTRTRTRSPFLSTLFSLSLLLTRLVICDLSSNCPKRSIKMRCSG